MPAAAPATHGARDSYEKVGCKCVRLSAGSESRSEEESLSFKKKLKKKKKYKKREKHFALICYANA